MRHSNPWQGDHKFKFKFTPSMSQISKCWGINIVTSLTQDCRESGRNIYHMSWEDQQLKRLKRKSWTDQEAENAEDSLGGKYSVDDRHWNRLGAETARSMSSLFTETEPR
ncbi:hypothetical protein ElyMa_002763000 [Elysia marginata]|uniref:Myb-like domain-containing protein n=1 Tax=Elysia marginata TaxID=1093978 RepID=A0AAV4HLU7_9GAST|nr:hypothetical protein ElyMa_002763000 [Elysia marginata]